MEEKPKTFLNKRRFWLCLILVFLFGILCGCIISVVGFKYMRTHFPPPLDRISRRITDRIAKDFALNKATRDAVEQEIFLLGSDISSQMGETRKSIEKSIEQRQENIGSIMPNEEMKNRWHKEYRSYFPPIPPLPGRKNPDR